MYGSRRDVGGALPEPRCSPAPRRLSARGAARSRSPLPPGLLRGRKMDYSDRLRLFGKRALPPTGKRSATASTALPRAERRPHSVTCPSEHPAPCGAAAGPLARPLSGLPLRRLSVQLAWMQTAARGGAEEAAERAPAPRTVAEG